MLDDFDDENDQSNAWDDTYRQLFIDLCAAKTSSQISNVLRSIPPLADGVITQSEYLIAKLASDHRIPKRVTNSVIATVKRDDFDPADVRFDRIQPIEALISRAHDGGTIQEFNFWKEDDGDQEVVLLLLIVAGE